MSRLKRLIVMLLVFIVILSSTSFVSVNAVSDRPYLVLIETQKGQWTAYKDMISISSKGTAMLKASEFCNAMGFEYSSNTKTRKFSIKKSEYNYNSYEVGRATYIYCKSKGSVILNKVQESVYYDKTLKMFLCDSASIASLCYTKVFPVANTAYINSGFTKIICYSTYGLVKALPDIKKLIYEDGIPLRDLGITYKSPDAKWETRMFYMDGIVNGQRKLWPMITQYSNETTWYVSGERIWVILDPKHYNPADASGKSGSGQFFSLFIKEKAAQGTAYTKEDKEVDLQFRTPLDGSSSGKQELFYSTIDDERRTIIEANTRLDTLDRDKGIVIGYLKLKAIDVSGNKVDIEGYFADKYKDDGARLTTAQIYSQLHPEDKTANGAKETPAPASNNGSNSYAPALKVPTVQYVNCPTCGGTGRISCFSCNGVGYTEHMGYQYGVYGRVVDTCMICGGTGSRTCTKCGGSGLITQISN